jgi:hypothetical protein
MKYEVTVQFKISTKKSPTKAIEKAIRSEWGLDCPVGDLVSMRILDKYEDVRYLSRISVAVKESRGTR